MKALDIPVNATSGANAVTIARAFLRDSLSDEGSTPYRSGFRTFDVGIAYEVDRRPFDKVVCQEDADEAALRTFLIDAHLYGPKEATR